MKSTRLLTLNLLFAAACAPQGSVSSDSAATVAPLAGERVYIIRNKANNLVLDVDGLSDSDGAVVWEWQENQGLNQQWQLVAAANGAYNFVNVNSGKCLDVLDGSTANGAILQQWDCWGGSNQAFYMNIQADGSFLVQGAGSGRCLDSPLGETSNGVRTQQWDCGSGSNQMWWFDAPASQQPPTSSPTPPAQFNLATTNYRGGDAPVYVRQSMYDYAPSVILENGVYRMWWCGSVSYEGGDHVLYAESNSLDGPWHSHTNSAANSFDDVFQPTYSANDWDGQDTCDPSVVFANGTYYLYYGGFPIANTPPTQVTAIGVASSPDGFNFQRLSSTPIITPARSTAGLYNPYGAGQPSVIYLNGLFYLAYTDTTGLGSAGPGAISGAGIYVLRSSDPLFRSGVEELGSAGFAAYNPSTHTQYPIVQAYTVDWAYSDALQRFVLANDQPGGAVLSVFDTNLNLVQSGLVITGSSDDGPGIVAQSNHHLPSGAACNMVPVDIMRAVSDQTGNTGPYSWDLGHSGVDLTASFSCQ